MNFAAETHVDRSILGATDFGRTEFFGTQVLLEEVRRTGAPLRAGLDGRGVRRPGARRLRRRRPTRSTPRARTASPRPPATSTCRAYVRTFGVDASITRGSNTYGPNQYPEKLVPLFVTNALDGEPLPVYGDGRQIRDWLHVEDHCAGDRARAARRRARRDLQHRRRERARERRDHAADRRAHGRRPGPRPPRHRSPWPRPPLLARLLEAARPRLGARAGVRGRPRARRSSGTGRTAPGGSRSSRASTPTTTGGSTRSGSPSLQS